jgi:hypothetical protein
MVKDRKQREWQEMPRKERARKLQKDWQGIEGWRGKRKKGEERLKIHEEEKIELDNEVKAMAEGTDGGDRNTENTQISITHWPTKATMGKLRDHTKRLNKTIYAQTDTSVWELITSYWFFLYDQTVRDGHGGGGSRKINAWHIYTLMVYL